jgi:hypothetical protein
MFSMTLASWRAQPFVRATYSGETIDGLDAAPSHPRPSQGEEEILWGLRQILIERT